MELLKNIGKIIMAALFAILTATGALAYSTVYPTEYGQPRMGAYSAVVPYGQGMYNYLSPPIALTRYGSDYHISNLRTAVYPNYPVTYLPTMHRPYMGYPYGIDRTPYVRTRTYGTGFY
jgi:hypothetical protein